MRLSTLLIPAFALAFGFSARDAFAQEYYGPPSFVSAQHEVEEAWERRGLNDGMRGAERDFGNHRRPNVNNREEYRDPDSVPEWARHEYREGFRRGYYLGVRRIYGGNDAYGIHQYWHEPR